MAVREIPAGSVEVQVGLWAYWREFTVGGTTYGRYVLYSAEGYCFYDLTDPFCYVDSDITGELLPENQRVYAQYQSTTCQTLEEVNARFVSVPVQDGYEIVSVGGGNDHEIA